ncbi:MAG: SPOR domain-containing protein [Bacteroidetes bacterium]|nr:MAG: SPOR domain-containing protein [Bacteroidota bacterium]
MKSGFLLLTILSLSGFVQAQTPGDSLRHFSVDSNILQDKRVNELMLKHILINEAKKEKMKGYRVQIHFGPEKSKALDVRANFTMQYANSKAHLDYHQPYFKIRVGDFRTKLEAYKLLQEISDDFPGAFIVSDEIDLPPL